jgi:hypothetical protein
MTTDLDLGQCDALNSGQSAESVTFVGEPMKIYRVYGCFCSIYLPYIIYIPYLYHTDIYIYIYIHHITNMNIHKT